MKKEEGAVLSTSSLHELAVVATPAPWGGLCCVWEIGSRARPCPASAIGTECGSPLRTVRTEMRVNGNTAITSWEQPATKNLVHQD